jgi:hypothetical protein
VAAALAAEYKAAGESVQTEARQKLNRHLANALREHLADPFRAATFEPSWRNAAVMGLAHAIATDGAFDLLPVLADALEEAGCNDSAILAHARGPNLHTSGCWVLDLVLDRDPGMAGRFPPGAGESHAD